MKPQRSTAMFLSLLTAAHASKAPVVRNAPPLLSVDAQAPVDRTVRVCGHDYKRPLRTAEKITPRVATAAPARPAPVKLDDADRAIIIENAEAGPQELAKIFSCSVGAINKVLRDHRASQTKGC